MKGNQSYTQRRERIITPVRGKNRDKAIKAMRQKERNERRKAEKRSFFSRLASWLDRFVPRRAVPPKYAVTRVPQRRKNTPPRGFGSRRSGRKLRKLVWKRQRLLAWRRARWARDGKLRARLAR